MIKDTWSINNLPSQVFIIKVTDEERFGRECVWLDIDICAGDFVNEGGFPNIGVSTNEKCPGIGVDGREAGNVLANLL
jgi:hypothetical protein